MCDALLGISEFPLLDSVISGLLESRFLQLRTKAIECVLHYGKYTRMDISGSQSAFFLKSAGAPDSDLERFLSHAFKPSSEDADRYR